MVEHIRGVKRRLVGSKYQTKLKRIPNRNEQSVEINSLELQGDKLADFTRWIQESKKKHQQEDKIVTPKVLNRLNSISSTRAVELSLRQVPKFSLGDVEKKMRPDGRKLKASKQQKMFKHLIQEFEITRCSDPQTEELSPEKPFPKRICRSEDRASIDLVSIDETGVEAAELYYPVPVQLFYQRYSYLPLDEIDLKDWAGYFEAEDLSRIASSITSDCKSLNLKSLNGVDSMESLCAIFETCFNLERLDLTEFIGLSVCFP